MRLYVKQAPKAVQYNLMSGLGIQDNCCCNKSGWIICILKMMDSATEKNSNQLRVNYMLFEIKFWNLQYPIIKILRY